MANLESRPIAAIQLTNTRNAIGIINVLGAVLLVIALGFSEEFTPNVLIWLGALFIGFIFYLRAGGFIEHPEQEKLGSLKLIQYAFIITWALAIITTLMIWEVVGVDTFLGILIVLASTYTMNQFISNGSVIVSSSPQRVQRQPTVYQSTDKVGQLERLTGLKERGSITEEEFQKEKAKIWKD